MTDEALTTGATPSTCSASSPVARASASAIVISAARVEVAFWLVVVSPPPNPGGPPAGPAGPPPRPPARPPAPPPPELAVIVSVLLPSELIESWTALLEPVPTATRMMTAATPIRMPSVVSADRVLFAVTPCQANRTRLLDVHDRPVSR